MPIKPSEVGSGIDFNAAKAFVAQIDNELKLADPDEVKFRGFWKEIPKDMSTALANWVAKQYQEAGWEAKIDLGSQRDPGRSLSLKVPKTRTLKEADDDYSHTTGVLSNY